MWLSLAEKQALIARYPWRFSYYILREEQRRGRKLNRFQLACIEAVLGPLPDQPQPAQQPQRGVPA